MTPVGFEPTIPANARPQTYALDRAAAGIGDNKKYGALFLIVNSEFGFQSYF
jgi:hypothetical protein